MPSIKARRFALTFWSKPDFPEHEDIQYFVSGEEVCPETKKIHYQSYISLKKPYRLTGLKKLINDDKCNILKCKGNEQQNIAYCKKDGKIYREFGTPKKQGERVDILNLRDHFKNGKRLREAVDDDCLARTVSKYPKFANMCELLYSKPRTDMTELHVYWGTTGAGKSHKAKEEAGDDVYYKPLGKNSGWWDGYEQQESVIIEDFRGEIPLATMLRLADKYPLRVPVKGGFKNFDSRKIYITSNVDCDKWFNDSQKGYDDSMKAFKRRITKKIHFDLPFNKK